MSFENYGGRGIAVCGEWRRFEPFYEWALSAGYAHGLQIDRIDNDGNYEPDNCRWVTRSVNCNNRRPKRTATKYTGFGETKTLEEWMQDPRCVVKKTTFHRRVSVYGFSTEEALTTLPIRGRSSRTSSQPI